MHLLDHYRTAELSDAVYLASNMRDADREELRLAHGSADDDEIYEILKSGIERSVEANTIIADDLPAAIFGVAERADGAGTPWLLATDAIDNFSRSQKLFFLRRSLAWVESIQPNYPDLTNSVYSRNTSAVEWLRWMQFDLGDTVDVNGYPFHVFHRYR